MKTEKKFHLKKTQRIWKIMPKPNTWMKEKLFSKILMNGIVMAKKIWKLTKRLRNLNPRRKRKLMMR